jgi:isocitrate dehydrogenase (NAD+)
MVAEGRARYANPCSVIRASLMLLEHIGYADKAARLRAALDAPGMPVSTGRDTGATAEELADWIMARL